MTTPLSLDSGAVAFFTADHRVCDELWAVVEEAAATGDKTAVQAAFKVFDADMRRHLDMEEQVLFPAIEDAIGGPPAEGPKGCPRPWGPTHMMRMEHNQMRGLLSQMALAISDPATLLEQGDTLLMLTQQHNMKEEGIVYPMAGRLHAQWPELAHKLAPYLAA